MAPMWLRPLKLAMDKTHSRVMANRRDMDHTASRLSQPIPKVVAPQVATLNRVTVSSHPLQLVTLPLLLPLRVTASQRRGMEPEGMLQPPLLPPRPAAARALMGSRVDMEPRLHTRDMGSSRPLEHHPATAPAASHPPAMSRTPTLRHPSRAHTPSRLRVVDTRASRVATPNRVSVTRRHRPLHPSSRLHLPAMLPHPEGPTVSHLPASMDNRGDQEAAMVSRVNIEHLASTATTGRIIPTEGATRGQSRVDIGAAVRAEAWVGGRAGAAAVGGLTAAG